MRTPDEFEVRLRAYVLERSEEGRAVRVGEKEISEQAAIVARHADLFTREQLAVLRDAEQAAVGEVAERLARLRLTCQDGLVDTELAAREDELENALLAARLDWGGAQRYLLAVLPDYADRDRLGERQIAVSARFNDRRLDLLTARASLEAELSAEADPVARIDAVKGISHRAVHSAVAEASRVTTRAWEPLRERWLDRLLGPSRDVLPSAAHVGWLRRLSPLADTYAKDRCVAVCSATLRAIGLAIEDETSIRLDLDDRPQKSPRACVIAADPPAVVHLITRAQGGLHDYGAFLHEAGHALHYASCDPSLPYAFRAIGRDHALTEIYSFVVEALSREPGWHAEHFGLGAADAERNAEATVFLQALLFRRYVAKLGFELAFWDRFEAGVTADGYAEALTQATGIRYARESFLSDMDAGFYSADYLRAWVRAAQLRVHLLDEVGADWWRAPATGEFLRELFREGLRPSSEEIAARLDFDPLDTRALQGELAA